MSDNEKPLGPNDARAITTAVTWICFTILMIIISSRDPHIFNFMLGVLTFMLAGGSTYLIWNSKIIDHTFVDQQKLKNSDRNIDAAALILQLLNDEERNTVRQRLLNNSDGEIPQIFAKDAVDDHYLDNN